jgi:hypothetical protein
VKASNTARLGTSGLYGSVRGAFTKNSDVSTVNDPGRVTSIPFRSTGTKSLLLTRRVNVNSEPDSPACPLLITATLISLASEIPENDSSRPASIMVVFIMSYSFDPMSVRLYGRTTRRKLLNVPPV